MQTADSLDLLDPAAIADWPVGVARCAADGAILSLNAAAADLLARFGPDPLAPNLFVQLRARAPDLRPALVHARAGGGRVERLLTAPGAAARLTLTRRGGTIVALLVDESARRRAEEDAARHRARFAALADGVPGGAAFSLDVHGRVNGWSRSAQRFEGLTAQEALGCSLDDLFARSNFSAGGAALVEAATRAGEASVAGLRWGAGSAPVPVTLTLRATRDASGGVDGFVAILREDVGGAAREAELRRLAGSDPLTHVMNRRAFEEGAEAARAAAERRGEPLSIVVVDMDGLKALNDTHGHAAGDAALRAVAQAAARGLRGGDLLGRIGGDEFAIALPGADLRHAALVAERLRGEIAALRPVVERKTLRVSASFGVASALDRGEPLARIVARADAALYRAKQSGRDRVAAA